MVTKNDDLNLNVDQTEKKLKSAISNLESLSNTILEAFETRDRLVNAIESNKGTVFIEAKSKLAGGVKPGGVRLKCEHPKRKS